MTQEKKSVNRWTTRELVTLALFSAMGMALSFIQIPIGPISYDASGVVILMAALLFGPVSGAAVAVISWIPKAIMDPTGALITIVCMVVMALVVGAIYQKNHKFSGAVIALIVGAIVYVIVALGMNFVVWPIYAGYGVQDVAGMILPFLLPFNAGKSAINAVITAVLYKPVSNLVKERDNRSQAAL